MIIFLDESGDLGFDFGKAKTSKKFAITLLVCEGYHATDNISKAVRRTLKNKLNRHKKNRRIVQELKGTKTNLTTRKAYGFRTYYAAEIALYHTLGALPEKEVAHEFF